MKSISRIVDAAGVATIVVVVALVMLWTSFDPAHVVAVVSVKAATVLAPFCAVIREIKPEVGCVRRIIVYPCAERNAIKPGATVAIGVAQEASPRQNVEELATPPPVMTGEVRVLFVSVCTVVLSTVTEVSIAIDAPVIVTPFPAVLTPGPAECTKEIEVVPMVGESIPLYVQVVAANVEPAVMKIESP